MNYLVSAVKFSIKNWMLILPLFVLTSLVSLIAGTGSAIGLGTIFGLMNPGELTDPNAILAAIPTIFAAAAGSSILAFLAQFIHQPATYGLVNKNLETGDATLNDLGAAINANFVKYILYFVGMLVVGLVVGIASVLILLLMGLLVTLLKTLGIILFVIVAMALAIIIAVLFILLSLWFSAMIVDNLDVVAAAKKSIEVVMSCFWTVLGITLLVSVVAGILRFILSFLNVIPVIGPIIYSVIPSAQTFIMIVFSLMLYRAKNGRENIV